MSRGVCPEVPRLPGLPGRGGVALTAAWRHASWQGHADDESAARRGLIDRCMSDWSTLEARARRARWPKASNAPPLQHKRTWLQATGPVFEEGAMVDPSPQLTVPDGQQVLAGATTQRLREENPAGWEGLAAGPRSPTRRRARPTTGSSRGPTKASCTCGTRRRTPGSWCSGKSTPGPSQGSVRFAC